MFELRSYSIVQRAIWDGIEKGWARAHKHIEVPSESVIKEEIENNIMLALDEVIIFDTIDN